MITAKVKFKPASAQNMNREINKFLDDIADDIFALSQGYVPVDEGMLKKSGHVERKFMNKWVVYDAPYAEYVEYGTGPHWPPLQPLVDWAHRVLGLPYARKKGERAKGFRAGKRLGFSEAAGMREGTAEQVGFLIAKKIAEKGTESQPYLRRALDEVAIKYQVRT